MDKSISFNPSINGNYNSASLNIAKGNITSNINIAVEQIKDLNESIESLKSLLIQQEFDNKEEIIDSLDIIKEQLEMEKPKKIRITSALEKIKSFALNIPKTIQNVEIIATSAMLLYEKLQSILNNIP